MSMLSKYLLRRLRLKNSIEISPLAVWLSFKLLNNPDSRTETLSKSNLGLESSKFEAHYGVLQGKITGVNKAK